MNCIPILRQAQHKRSAWERVEGDLANIQIAGQQLLELINNVLDISKIEADKMRLMLQAFEVSRVTEDVVTMIQPCLAQNELQVDIADDLGTMYADPNKVQQILLNLLNNAVKFTTQGQIFFHVEREYAMPEQGNTGADHIVFRVQDTGIGMSSEQLQHVFEAFSQADSSTTRQYGGSGLGLTLSEHFCRMMGGTITVESQLGKGSTFVVRLPALVVEG